MISQKVVCTVIACEYRQPQAHDIMYPLDALFEAQPRTSGVRIIIIIAK